MDAPDRHSPDSSRLRRRYVELPALLALLFVAQTGLVPLDFTGAEPDGARVYFDTRPHRLVLADIVSNIFLYVPLSGLLFLAIRRRGHGGIIAALLGLGGAVVLAAGIEHVQYYSPSRVSSLIDLVSNAVGAAVGVAVAWSLHAVVPRLVDAVRFEMVNRPRASILKLYVLALFIVACLPFSFSFSGTRLVQSVKATHWVPFEAARVATTTSQDANASKMATVHQDYAYRLWSALKCWSRWAAECASFVLFAWLLQPLLRLHYGFARRGADALTWWFGGALAIGLSVIQVPIMSREADVTDILFRLLGVSVGIVLRGVRTKHEDPLPREERMPVGPIRARWMLAGVIAYVVYNGIIPLTVSAEGGGPASVASSRAFLPFMAYFVARFDVMMADVMEKFASFIVLGVLLTVTWARVGRCAVRDRVAWVVATCVALSSVIELAQVYITVRVPSLTDPILAATGAAVGVVSHAHVSVFYGRVVALEAAMRQAADDPAPSLSPTDELMSTLTEPHPDAPVERPPETPVRRER